MSHAVCGAAWPCSPCTVGLWFELVGSHATCAVQVLAIDDVCSTVAALLYNTLGVWLRHAYNLGGFKPFVRQSLTQFQVD